MNVGDVFTRLRGSSQTTTPSFVELLPRVDVDYSKVDLYSVFGRRFASLYYRDDKYLHFCVNTMTARQSLAQYFGSLTVSYLASTITLNSG